MKAAIPHLMAVIIIAVTFMACTQKDYTNITNPGFIQPEISIILPAPGDTLRGLVAISVQASGSAAISYVEFYIDGVLPDSQANDSSAPYEYLWNSVNYADGNHLLFARGWTPEGNYGDAVPLLVLVDNINENAPRTLRVPSQYPTIQQGINAAKDGDTVLVEPGLYYEEINFHGKGICVKSEEGPAQTMWEGLYQIKFAHFMSGEDTTSVLCGFMLTNSYNGILLESSCSPTIRNCIIKNMAYTGIIGGPVNAKLINNTIFNCQYGMSIGGISTVRNNIVVQGSQIGLWNSSAVYQYRAIGDYNDIWDWGESFYGNNWIPGDHDIHLNPLFEDTINFRLSSVSPCVNTGDPNIFDLDGSQSDMGAWGGPYAYQ